MAQALGGSRFVAFDAERVRFTLGEGHAVSAVNLAAVSGSLFESELFGHAKGSFTGAVSDHKGVFESARPGGVVFLDEVSEVVPEKQATLLRVLQERRFRRVGDVSEKPITARIVSATHRDLTAQVTAGTFRQDLLQRLAGVRISTPSPREQLDDAPDDLSLLVRVLAHRMTSASIADRLAEDTIRDVHTRLSGHAWPGNVRELGNCIQSLLYGAYFLPQDPHAEEDPARSLRDGRLTLKEANSGASRRRRGGSGSTGGERRAEATDGPAWGSSLLQMPLISIHGR